MGQSTSKSIRESLRPPPSISIGNGSIPSTRSAFRWFISLFQSEYIYEIRG